MKQALDECSCRYCKRQRAEIERLTDACKASQRAMLTAQQAMLAAQAEIERLTARNAALIECLLGSRCPVDYRVTVADCQQCGCTHGLFTRDGRKLGPTVKP